MRTLSILALLLLAVRLQASPPAYDRAYAESARTGKPLVVFTGYAEAYELKGVDVVKCHINRLEGYPPYCVVVSFPVGGELKWFRTLEDTDSSEEQVKLSIQEGLVWARADSPKASPKSTTVQPDGLAELPVGSVEALDRVNARRAKHGLRPLIFDAGLTLAAARAAAYRAERLLFGHCPSDFVHLPQGCNASAAGCAAYDPAMVQLFDGWLSCCSDDVDYTYGGAAYVVGRDGRMFMHLFVR